MTRLLVFFLLVTLLAVSGCQDRSAQLAADQQNFKAVAEAQSAELQWKLDDATAVSIFRTDADGGDRRYLAFRKCHEEPPTHDANKKACAALQYLVAKAEARAQAQTAKEKASW